MSPEELGGEINVLQGADSSALVLQDGDASVEDEEPTEPVKSTTEPGLGFIGWRGTGKNLVVMAWLGFFWGGACFGFNGIKRVLLAEGVFEGACGETAPPCGAQLESVDAAWTFSSSMLNVFAIINGAAIDALGLRRVCLLSAVLLSLGTVCFGFVVSVEELEMLLPYSYFALVESGMLLSFGGLSLQGEEGAITIFGRHTFDVKVVSAPVMETSFALGTLMFPVLGLIYDAVPGTLVTVHCVYFGCAALLISICGLRFQRRELRYPARDITAALDRRALRFVVAAACAVGANITQQGYYVATFAEQAEWHHQKVLLTAILDWGFPALALPSLVIVGRLEEHWHEASFETHAWRGYAVLAVSQLLWGVLSCLRDWHLQILAVMVFVPARLLGFVHLYECVGFYFPSEHFGVVAGTCLTVGGLLAAVASHFLQSWLLDSSSGELDPRGPNMVLCGSLVLVNVIAAVCVPKTEHALMRRPPPSDGSSGLKANKSKRVGPEQYNPLRRTLSAGDIDDDVDDDNDQPSIEMGGRVVNGERSTERGREEEEESLRDRAGVIIPDSTPPSSLDPTSSH